MGGGPLRADGSRCWELSTSPLPRVPTCQFPVRRATSRAKGLRNYAACWPLSSVRLPGFLTTTGPDAAIENFHRLAAIEPAEFDLDDEWFIDAVWGAIELHRTSLVWPLLRVWTALRPDSSAAWTMTGWAQQVDGDLDQATRLLERALDLDPDNDDAALLLHNIASK